MESAVPRSRISRRRLLELVVSVPAVLGLAACTRRADVPVDATPAAPAVSTAVPAVAAPAATTAPAPAPAPTAAAAGAAKPGGRITAAVQNDWVTFDTI